jgi:DNA-binding NtrC family response regulator
LPSRVVAETPLQTLENLSYREGVTAARKELVVRALRRTDGNRSAAAKLLRLEAKYFLKLIKSLQVD